MPNRASVNQIAQLGMETTPGTSVAATKLMVSTSIEPGIKADTKSFRAQGRKYGSLVYLGKESSEIKLTGPLSFTECIYWYSSALGIVTPTLHTGGTLSHDWTFIPVLTGPANPQTFTIEKGDSVRAFKLAYGLVTGFGIKYTRDSVDFTGTMIGQQLQDGITLTSTGVTQISQQPVTGVDGSFFLDTTAAAIGTTQLMDVLEGNFSFEGAYGEYWPINRNNASFTSHVDMAPKTTFKLKMQADTTGMAQLNQLRAGNTVYIRANSVGSNIELSIPYTHQLDMACKVQSAQAFSDDGGVYAIEWTFEVVEDTTLAKAFSILSTNALTAL